MDRNRVYKNVEVCSEYYLTVHHCLLARKGLISQSNRDYGSITKLYTHPQAWGQCDNFLRKHFKGVERQDVSSTSKAAETVSKTTAEINAAIASRFAGEHYGLDIVDENIEDIDKNTTRFLILRNVNSVRTAQTGFESVQSPSMQNRPPTVVKKKKTLTSFMIRQDAPGTLADALLIFKNFGMNLTSISSRPSQIQAWKYVFLVESETDQNREVVPDILESMREVTENCRHLGTWANQLVSA